MFYEVIFASNIQISDSILKKVMFFILVCHHCSPIFLIKTEIIECLKCLTNE